MFWHGRGTLSLAQGTTNNKDGLTKIEVELWQDTVRLSLEQMAALQQGKSTVSMSG